MANFLDAHGLQTLIGLIKGWAASTDHKHAAADITSGTIESDRLPTVPVSKGGTGATDAATALSNLGLESTADEIDYTAGALSKDTSGNAALDWGTGWLKGRVLKELWSGSLAIDGSTEASISVPGASRYNVLVFRFSGRGARIIAIRGTSNFESDAEASTFYGTSAYNSGNGAQTYYSVSATFVNDTLQTIRNTNHVLGAQGVLSNGNATGTLTSIEGVL